MRNHPARSTGALIVVAVLVIGGGVAGCAAAVAAAERGAQVTLVEAGHVLGGVAVTAAHRELCGLAAIDAAQPDLLEPDLAGPWAQAAATGSPYRHGRVWLWPTDERSLAEACAGRCRDAGVEVRLNAPLLGLTRGAVDWRADLAPGPLPVDAVVDASGRGLTARFLGLAMAPAVQWGAHRCELDVPPSTAAELRRRVGRLAALRRIASATGLDAGCFLVELPSGRWHLTLDVPPGTTRTAASLSAAAAADALAGTVASEVVGEGERDAGRPAGGITLAELFAHRERGLCWAAWPREEHGARGVTWTWPPGDRHGVPPGAVLIPGAPPGLWCIGKGMPVEAAAAAALRVTGTCFAVGAAVGRLAAAPGAG